MMWLCVLNYVRVMNSLGSSMVGTVSVVIAMVTMEQLQNPSATTYVHQIQTTYVEDTTETLYTK